MKLINLNDKISVIAGAAGDIGTGISKALAEAGSKIIALDID